MSIRTITAIGRPCTLTCFPASEYGLPFLSTFQGRLYRTVTIPPVSELPEALCVTQWMRPQADIDRDASQETLWFTYCQWVLIGYDGEYIGEMTPFVQCGSARTVWGFVPVRRIQRWWKQTMAGWHQKRALALCMGVHQRLGKDCLLGLFPKDLLQSLMT